MTPAPLDWANALEMCEDGALGVYRRTPCGTFGGHVRGRVAGTLPTVEKNTGPVGMPLVGVPRTCRCVRSYLVDPASSHMLVSKIKPCMSKYKQHLYCETANGSLNQL